MPKPDIPPGTKRWVCAAEHTGVRAQLDELLAAVEEHETATTKGLKKWSSADQQTIDDALYADARRIKGDQ